jgi:hypothetical protein
VGQLAKLEAIIRKGAELTASPPACGGGINGEFFITAFLLFPWLLPKPKQNWTTTVIQPPPKKHPQRGHRKGTST